MTDSRQRVSTGSPYEPRVGFSRAVRVGQVIAVSGTAPIAPDGTTAAPGDAAAQARRCFEIIQEALEELGAGLDAVIRTRLFLTNAEDWEAIGLVHGEFFGDIRPAATMVEVSGLLDSEWLVEVEADAIVPEL